MEDIEVSGRIILKLIFKKWNAGAEWIDVARERDRWWWALLIDIMKLGFQKIRGISFIAENLLASQGLCSMLLVIHISSHIFMPVFIFVSPFVVTVLTAVWTFRPLISGEIKRRFSSHNVPILLFIGYHDVFRRGVKRPEREVDHYI